MCDREKVIRGLECRSNSGIDRDCENCHYGIHLVRRWGCDFVRLCDEALKLLTEQGQKVRCAECKHCFDADRGTPYDGDDEWYCRKWERYVSAYSVDPYRFYCAAGERREVRVKDQVCGGDGYGTE